MLNKIINKIKTLLNFHDWTIATTHQKIENNMKFIMLLVIANLLVNLNTITVVTTIVIITLSKNINDLLK